MRVVSINFKQQKKLFSVPLPANEKTVLTAPFDVLFALPEPTGKPEGLPIEMVSTRFIANTIAPQHIVSLWKCENGTFWSGKGSIEYAPSDADPLAKLSLPNKKGRQSYAAALGEDELGWRARLRAAVKFALAGRLVITRKGKVVDPADFRGVYRLGALRQD